MASIPEIEKILTETEGATFNFNFNKKRGTWRAYNLRITGHFLEDSSLLNLFDKLVKHIKESREPAPQVFKMK